MIFLASSKDEFKNLPKSTEVEIKSFALSPVQFSKILLNMKTKTHSAIDYLFEFIKYMQANINLDEKNKEIYEHSHPILTFLWSIDRDDMLKVIVKSKTRALTSNFFKDW